MTEQELYIWLLNCDSGSKMNLFELGVNLEILNNYEIAKLFLEKIGIHVLREHQQKYLNLDAISSWFRVSDYIHLQYDIPKMLELLPERTVGHLDLQNSQIQSLPELESVGGNLNLVDSKIKSLPELEYVGGEIDFYDSEIQYLPKLESVGGSLYLQKSKIKTFPNLTNVTNFIYTGKENQDNYWKNYFREIGRLHLATKARP